MLIALGLGYLVTIFLNSSGSRLPRDVLPRPALYFAQVACLFPHAAPVSIEYRLEAYSCSQRRFIPFDHRLYFPLHPNDKENRMHRAAAAGSAPACPSRQAPAAAMLRRRHG